MSGSSEPCPPPSVGAAVGVLWFCGLAYVLIGLGMAPWSYFLFALDPELPDAIAQPMGLGFAAVSVLLCGGIAAANIATAIGLQRGAPWAWYAGVVLGGMYVASACMPLGAVLLWQLLQEPTRAAFRR